jgi:long-chain fatty acid transport protein
MYLFGATRYLNDGFRVSAGYAYSQNTVPSSSFSPLLPDSTRHIFTAGFGRSKGAFSWDVAYEFSYGPDRSIYNAAFIDDGTYRFISHAVSISFGYHF